MFFTNSFYSFSIFLSCYLSVDFMFFTYWISISKMHKINFHWTNKFIFTFHHLFPLLPFQLFHLDIYLYLISLGNFLKQRKTPKKIKPFVRLFNTYSKILSICSFIAFFFHLNFSIRFPLWISYFKILKNILEIRILLYFY